MLRRLRFGALSLFLDGNLAALGGASLGFSEPAWGNELAEAANQPSLQALSDELLDIGEADIDHIPATPIDRTIGAAEPPVTVRYEGTLLQRDKDYTLSHSNNTRYGVGACTIASIGRFTGSASMNFDVNRNGQVNIVDVQIACDMATGGADYSTYPASAWAKANVCFAERDICQDEVTDAADSRAIHYYVMKRLAAR